LSTAKIVVFENFSKSKTIILSDKSVERTAR
jgi:hypothetical protein